jgi:DNA-binding XRE family transcriptional regulator
MPRTTTQSAASKARRKEARRAFLFDHHSDQPSQLYRHFGKQIRERREKAGLTQTELAKEVSISRGYLSQIEAGQRQVSLHVALKLASMLQLSIDKLLEIN